jgi:hypothetical protein
MFPELRIPPERIQKSRAIFYPKHADFCKVTKKPGRSCGFLQDHFKNQI